MTRKNIFIGSVIGAVIILTMAAIVLSKILLPSPLKIGVIDLARVVKDQQDHYIALKTGPDKDLKEIQEKAQKIINDTSQKLNQLDTWLPQQCGCLVLNKTAVIALPPAAAKVKVLDLTPIAIDYINGK